jgi:hypothetical protein
MYGNLLKPNRGTSSRRSQKAQSQDAESDQVAWAAKILSDFTKHKEGTKGQSHGPEDVGNHIASIASAGPVIVHRREGWTSSFYYIDSLIATLHSAFSRIFFCKKVGLK